MLSYYYSGEESSYSWMDSCKVCFIFSARLLDSYFVLLIRYQLFGEFFELFVRNIG